MSEPLTNRAQKIWDALPQTQCTRCGYPDCEAYARAIDAGDAPINQCPPGGQEGIERLAALMQTQPLPLNPENGIETPRVVVWIDENWCIGCTLCIKACPVDAIVGANKRMHTVIESECNGCELCIPACPVDCILTENISGSATGWAAWGQAEADNSRQRYLARKARLIREADLRETRHLQALESKAENLSAHSQITDPALLDKKKSVIELALARARVKAGQK